MSSRTLPARHTFGLALVLGVAMSIPSLAATEAPDAVAAATAPAPLEELEEVWVRGKSLVDRITEAEDEFFALYNMANKVNKFDVQCGYATLDRDSMVMVRTCLPQFLAMYSSNYLRSYPGYTYAPTYRSNNSSTCYGPPTVSEGGSVYYEGGCYGSVPEYVPVNTSRLDTYANGYVGGGYGSTPSASLMAMHYREDYAKNVINVINSDPVLLEKAQGLAVLYDEMEAAQGRYKELRQITRRKPVNDKAKARKAARRGFDRTGG